MALHLNINNSKMRIRSIYWVVLLCIFSSCTTTSQTAPIAEIPFRIDEDGRMIITLIVNGQEINNVIFDTGASISTLDKTLVSRLGLKLQKKTFTVTGANGSQRIQRTKAYTFYMQENLVLKDIKSNAYDLTTLHCDGIIGYDILKKHTVKINFDTQLLSFYKKKKLPIDNKDYTKLSIAGSFEIPKIPISFRLNNHLFEGDVLFDTGNTAAPLFITSTFEEKHHIVEKFKRTVSVENKGLVLKSINQYGALDTLQIGGDSLTDVPVIVSTAKAGVLSRSSILGILGLEMIRKFNVIIDFSGKAIYLTPNTSYQNLFKFPLSGIRLKEVNNEIFISSVLKPSEAHNKGIVSNQKLIAINGIEGESKAFYKELLSQKGKEITVTVQLKSKEYKTVKILLKRLF